MYRFEMWKGLFWRTWKKKRDDSDLTVTTILKPDSTKKMKLLVTGYYQGEYLCMLLQGIWCKQAK